MEFASCVLVTKVDQHMDSMAQSQKGWNSHQNVRCVRAEKKQRKNCVTTKCGCMEEHQSCPQKMEEEEEEKNVQRNKSWCRKSKRMYQVKAESKRETKSNSTPKAMRRLNRMAGK